MTNIICHGHSQKAEVFFIKPTIEMAETEKVLYLKECNVCGNPVLEIYRTDVYGESLESVRIKTKNIEKFLSKMVVLKKEKKEKVLKNNNPTWVYSDGTKKGDKSYIYDFRGNYKVGEEKPLLLLSQA